MGTNPSAYSQRQPTIPVSQSIYEDSSTKKTQLGYGITVGDRKFKYASAAKALAAGDVVANLASTQCVNNTSAAAAIGTVEVTVYITDSVNADYFADGYLIAADETGLGYNYKVRSHAAIGDTSTGTVTLYDPVAVALTATSEVTLVPSKYAQLSDVITSTTPIQGVAPCAVSSGEYFWLQTDGPAAALVNTTVAYGNLVAPATAGGLTVQAASANAQVIGIALAAGTTGDTAPVLLQLG